MIITPLLSLSALLSGLNGAAASPITLPSTPRALSKRAPSSYTLGIGFAIAISLILFAILVFYLGVRRGQTGTWLCWRAPLENTPAAKAAISSPVTIHSSALLELSPVEAKPRFAELAPAEARPVYRELGATEHVVHEMGQASPRRPPSVRGKHSRNTSVETQGSCASKGGVRGKSGFAAVKAACRKSVQGKAARKSSWFERQSWFCKDASKVEDEEKRNREKEDEEKRNREKQAREEGCGAEPSAHTVAADKVQGPRESRMDWSGMEWVAGVYGRKDKRVSGLRSFYL